MLTATVFLPLSEKVLDSGLLLVDADEFLPLSAAAPEHSGVLTATVFWSSSEEVLDSGLVLVDVEYFAAVNLSAAALE